MLNKDQKHELIVKVIDAQLKKYTYDVIQKTFEEFTYNSYEDFKVKSKDALKFSNAMLDSSYILDSECAYKGLDMIADHLKRMLTSQ